MHKPFKKYDFIMFFLITYVLGEMAIEIVVDFSDTTLYWLTIVDTIICIIFLYDWIFFLLKTDDKKNYIKKRFIDLISSLPFAQILRPLRVFRFVRLTRTLRMIKGLRGASPLFRIILKNPARSALSLYSLLTILIFGYCTLGLYNFEFGKNENIGDLGDVIWMAFTTLTTVGYGDLYPVTTGGRVMAGILVITGMGLFGLLISEVATLLLKLSKHEQY